MPIQPCQKEGQPGQRWGQTGTCYTGPDARKKAQAQAAAIQAQQDSKRQKRDG
jgi:hypothetical protein